MLDYQFGYKVRSNQEMLAIGVANMVHSFSARATGIEPGADGSHLFLLCMRELAQPVGAFGNGRFVRRY